LCAVSLCQKGLHAKGGSYCTRYIVAVLNIAYYDYDYDYFSPPAQSQQAKDIAVKAK